MSSCVMVSCLFDVDEVAYGSSIPPAAPFPRGLCGVRSWVGCVCNASPSFASVVVSGQEASSFRHVWGLSTSGAESQFF
jgi:hypothetical protein